MASGSKKTDEKMKQKSLMSFFGKKDDTKSTPAGKSKPTTTPKVTKTKAKDVGNENPPSSPVMEHRTPLPKGSSQSSGIVSATYTRSSEGGKSALETPPTSDPIDIDMLSELDASEGAPSSTAKSVSSMIHMHIASYMTAYLHRLPPETSARSL